MRRISIFTLMCLLFILPAALRNAAADEFRSLMESANELYEAEKYDEALETYEAAKDLKPSEPLVHYNLGNVLYRQGKLDEAIEQFRQVYSKERSELNASAQYNVGCAQYRQAEKEIEAQNLQGGADKLREALTTYRMALRDHPRNLDMKYNYSQTDRKLKEVLEKIEEQQQQQQNEDKQEEQQEEQKEEDKKQQPSSDQDQQKDSFHL